MLNASLDDIINAGGRTELEKQKRAELEQQMASGQFNHPRENKKKADAKRKIKAIKGVAGRAAKAGGKMALKGAIFGGSKVASVGTRATLAAMGAATAGVISVGTGQGDKAITNMMAGAVAGNAMGRNLYNSVGAIGNMATTIPSKVENAVDTMQNAINEEFYGYSAARDMKREKQTEKARKDFYKNSSQIRNCRNIASQISGYTGNLKDVQDAVFDMKKAGITDDKLIAKTLNAEYKRDGELNGKNHKQFVDVASFSHQQGMGYKDMAESKSREKLETMIQGKVSGTKAQGEAERMFAEIWGAEEIYKKHGKLGKQPRQQPVNKSKEANKKKSTIVDKNGNPIGGGQQPVNKPIIVDKNGNPIG